MYLHVAKSVLATPRLHLETFSNEAFRTAVDDFHTDENLFVPGPGARFSQLGRKRARSRREKHQGAP